MLYATKSTNTISQTDINNYNQFRSIITEALRWLQVSTYTRKKLNVDSTFKEKYQKLLEFITIYVVRVEQQQSIYQDIITLPMNPIINSYFNKHPMKW